MQSGKHFYHSKKEIIIYKKLIFSLAIVFTLSGLQAQKKGKAKELDGLWYQNNLSKKAYNIDLNKAYSELLKDKKPTAIVVAVIDGGTDPHHPDLKANMWHNPGEIPFNNIDDDNNGYVDDTVGWNFIGGKDGGMVHHDNLEITRLVREMQKEFGELDASDIDDPAKRARYELYQTLKTEVEESAARYTEQRNKIKPVAETFAAMYKKMGKTDPTKADVEAYTPANEQEKGMKRFYLAIAAPQNLSFKQLHDEFKSQLEHLNGFADYHYNLSFDPRSVVGDNYYNASERYYGNNNVAGPDAFHGTHVAGIIGAVRGNGIGVEGVANAVKLMVVRVVPDGDERDKDVANGIRYAVDNGAKIINMSFGKSYKYNKSVVDSAVAYAVSKGVLLIHAAGNDAENNDYSPNYPNDSLPGGSVASTWIEVGASQPEPAHLATSFSNYGKANVDLFAPGYRINSTAPNNTYDKADGTSMAAPVVSGVAALVWSHYPSLTALQMKEILMKSGTPYKKSVVLPGTSKTKIKFTELSVSGVVVNAYSALKMAEQMAAGK